MAEADSLQDGLMAADYINNILIEFGLVAPAAMRTLSDNDGLVATMERKSKGGSKIQRRKLGIIKEYIVDGRFEVEHCPDAQMPVDFMTKLVSTPKLGRSVAFLYNTKNAVKVA